jgi:hypothetical protein
LTYPGAATPLGRKDYFALRDKLAAALLRHSEFLMSSKHLPMTVSVLDTDWRTPYGARAFGTVVTAVGTFKGLNING